MKNSIRELFSFFIRNAWSCLFPVLIFSLLAVSKMFPLPFMARYDFLLIACLAIQVLMVMLRFETRDEALVITLFHILGVSMEIFKVKMGSWSYPEEAFTKVAGVPLYSGFMYASVASYMCQAWRRLDLKITGWPPQWMAWLLAAAVYLNFFTHHFLYDFRWLLLALILLVFLRSKVFYSTTRRRWMPVSLSFFLIGFFIWIAENIATFFGAWKYAGQHSGWQAVSYQKVISWTLMSIVSYIIVAQLKFVKENLSHPPS